VLVGEVMPRGEFTRTEFFNDFLARDGLHWGVNLYAWDGGRNIGDMRIWRDRRRGDFGAAEKELLDLVRPAFTAALRRCRGGLAAVERSDASRCPLDALLSEREREVANLAACGLSDKEISRRLGIAVTTVRTHIDHAFRKLNVDKRVKLANKLGR
jgi:DNA-binding CsgD family transcriptional regulator